MAKEDQVQKQPEKAPAAPAPKAKVYTYVGKGEQPPAKINFMGLQTFIRGKAVEVSHPDVLNKLAKHPCFVEGSVELEDLHKQDEAALAIAEQQRAEDMKVNKRFQKEQRALAPKGEE